MRGLAGMLRDAFPDLRFEIEELVAEGGVVAGRLIMSGTHEGPLVGVPPKKGFPLPDAAVVDTAADTTRRATRGIDRQPVAKKPRQVSRFCNLRRCGGMSAKSWPRR